MTFHSGLIVREEADGAWSLHHDLVYSGNKDTFCVPAGFRTDLASVPRVFWNLFPPFHPTYTKAAVLHDWLLTQPVSRKDADGLFYRVMKEEGTRRWRAWVMWKAVRLFSVWKVGWKG